MNGTYCLLLVFLIMWFSNHFKHEILAPVKARIVQHYPQGRADNDSNITERLCAEPQMSQIHVILLFTLKGKNHYLHCANQETKVYKTYFVIKYLELKRQIQGNLLRV